MRVRLTDGTHEVEITIKGHTRRRLDDAENAALRMLDALRPAPPTDEPAPRFGFTPDRTLDGVTLDSNVERAEPHTEPGRDDDQYDDEDGQT